MQTILILLFNTFVLGAAQIVSLEGFYDSLLDWKVQKRDEPEYFCKDSPLDIVLIIDSSRSINELEFKEQIVFLVQFVALFDIHPSKVRFAAVSFGQHVIRQGAFNFNKYNSTAEVQWGLERIRYNGMDFGSETNTAAALTYVRVNYFRRARPEARKLCIVLTDGRSTNPKKTKEEAALLKSNKVTMVAIGIGDSTSMEELKGIASSSDYVFTVDKHSLLETIQKKLILKTCKDVEFVTTKPTIQNDRGDNSTTTTETPPGKNEVTTKEPRPEKKKVTTKEPRPEKNKVTTKEPRPEKNKVTTKEPPKGKNGGCNGPVDINFVFNPAQIGTHRIMTFIENTVTSKALANGDVRVGTITAPFQDVAGFRLNRYTTKIQMKKHFDEYENNQLAPQLNDLRLNAFLPINGGRPNARRVGVVFLRGKLDDEYPTVVAATKAQANGIEIYTIDLGDTEPEVIINFIASSRDHMLRAPNTNDFLGLSKEFMKFICKD